MDIFIARQGIYNYKEKIVAYELLYRDSLENKFSSDIDEDKATYKLIENINSFGLDTLTDNKRAFINFTESLIKNNFATILPKEKVVIEILENVEANKEVLQSLAKLRKDGYIIALDDLEKVNDLIKFVDYIDIVKIDFLISEKEERKRIANVCNKLGIKTLAEKIETKEELNEAIKLGCDYFQGYYFSKPSIFLGKDVEVKNVSIMNILKELSNEEYDVKKVEMLMKNDIGLTYKFFQFINSSYFSFLQKIESIKQAIMLIGKKELRKWLFILSVSEIATLKSEEYSKNITIRARFNELIAEEIGKIEKNSAFIVGLFSDLHLMINKDMERILNKLPLNNDIKDALIGRENIYKDILDLTLAYEKVDTKEILRLSKKINIESSVLLEKYYLTLDWCSRLPE